MWDTCSICGCIFDTFATAGHYAWHATHGEFPPGREPEPDPVPDPEEGS